MANQQRMIAGWAKSMRKRAGIYLKTLREDSKQTQHDVAHKMGWTYYTMVSQIERGLARLPPEETSRYAAVLGVPPKVLATRLLYFYDPFVYHAIFGGEHPLESESLAIEKNSSIGKRVERRPMRSES